MIMALWAWVPRGLLSSPTTNAVQATAAGSIPDNATIGRHTCVGVTINGWPRPAMAPTNHDRVCEQPISPSSARGGAG